MDYVIAIASDSAINTEIGLDMSRGICINSSTSSDADTYTYTCTTTLTYNYSDTFASAPTSASASTSLRTVAAASSHSHHTSHDERADDGEEAKDSADDSCLVLLRAAWTPDSYFVYSFLG